MSDENPTIDQSLAPTPQTGAGLGDSSGQPGSDGSDGAAGMSSGDLSRPAHHAPVHLGPGVQIGHYRIVRQIGEGGMGVVYEAQQERPQRRVALKVIHPGIATGQLLRRFEHEVEVLGRLRHPGIAQIYEAGMFHTASGAQPFFAMEYVDGMWLTQFIKEKDPPLRQRIDLIIKICQAVHHAHQKGVIHRDLKPANIIVDHEGQPKVLDFGVARATDGDLRTATMQTDVGQLLGTVPYMSPEQARGVPDELDSRSDVYALGVVCYELLAGQLPYDIHRRMIHEAVRVIQEQDPRPLSTFDLNLRGDIETIINKALEKDKARRYQSSSELASDFQRFLNHEPITAHPPSVWYQVVKFSRRNRTLVGGVTGIALAISIGLAISTTLYFRAVAARHAETQARHRAQTAAAITRQVNNFLIEDLLLSAQPQRSPGRVVTVLEVLANASRGLEDGRFAQQPLVEASVREAVGNSYRAIGEYEPATLHLQQAAALRADALGDNHPATQAAMNDLAAVLYQRGQYDAAHAIWHKLHDQRRREHGPRHPATLAVRLNLSLLAMDRADDAAARAGLRQNLRDTAADCAAVLGPTHPMTLVAMRHLVDADLQRGRLDAAQDTLEQVLGQELADKPPAHPDVLIAAHQLAELRHRRGEQDESEPLLRTVYFAMRNVLGEAHPDTLEARRSMGRLYLDQGRIDAAEPITADVLARRETVLGKTHRDTVTARADLAAVHLAAGRYDQAQRLCEQVLTERRAAAGDTAQPTLAAMVQLAGVRRARGDQIEALSLLEQALAGQQRLLGQAHPDTLATRNNLANVYWTVGNFDAARTHAERAVERYRTTFGPAHPDTLLAINNLALVYLATSEYAAAANAWQIAIQFANAEHGGAHWITHLLRNNLGWLLRDLGRAEQALALIAPAHEAYVKQFGPDHPRTLAIESNLAMAKLQLGRTDEARTHLTRVLEQRRAQLGDEHVDTATAAYRLARVYGRVGQIDRARALCTEAMISRDRALGRDHPETLKALNLRIRLALAEDDAQTADTWSRRLIDAARTRLKEDDRWFGEHLLTVAMCHAAAGRDDQARQGLEQARQVLARRLGEDHPRIDEADQHLGQLAVNR